MTWGNQLFINNYIIHVERGMCGLAQCPFFYYFHVLGDKFRDR